MDNLPNNPSISMLNEYEYEYVSDIIPYEEWYDKETKSIRRLGDTFIEVISNSSDINHISYKLWNDDGSLYIGYMNYTPFRYGKSIVIEKENIPLICMQYCKCNIKVSNIYGNDVTSSCSMKYGYFQTKERMHLMTTVFNNGNIIINKGKLYTGRNEEPKEEQKSFSRRIVRIIKNLCGNSETHDYSELKKEN